MSNYVDEFGADSSPVSDNNNREIMTELCKEIEDTSHIKNLSTDFEQYHIWNTNLHTSVNKNPDSICIQNTQDKIDTIKQIKQFEHKMWPKEIVIAYKRKLRQNSRQTRLSPLPKNDIVKAVSCNQVARQKRAVKSVKLDKDTKSNKVLNFMSEEEEEEYLDSLYRPKKKNNRKHNLNLFIYLILKTKTNANHHLTQTNILNILHSEFELDVERKAVSRAIHDIEDEQLGIFSNPREGAWYDAYSNEHDE